MNQYEEWIAGNVTKAYGECAQVTVAMQQAFPELTRVRGHYYCFAWGERSHWWLVAPDGSLVDPTKDQFPSKGNGDYVPWDDSSPEPTGKCLSCGEYVYGGRSCCSEQCSDDVVRFTIARPPRSPRSEP